MESPRTCYWSRPVIRTRYHPWFQLLCTEYSVRALFLRRWSFHLSFVAARLDTPASAGVQVQTLLLFSICMLCFVLQQNPSVSSKSRESNVTCLIGTHGQTSHIHTDALTNFENTSFMGHSQWVWSSRYRAYSLIAVLAFGSSKQS